MDIIRQSLHLKKMRRAGGILALTLGIGSCASFTQKPPPDVQLDPPVNVIAHDALKPPMLPEDETRDTPPPIQGKSGESMPGGSKVTQCKNELLALQKISPSIYPRYRATMDKLIASGQRYMAVQGGLSSDIHDILQPRYQFGMANLCWRIRNELSHALIEQINNSGDAIIDNARRAQ